MRRREMSRGLERFSAECAGGEMDATGRLWARWFTRRNKTHGVSWLNCWVMWWRLSICCVRTTPQHPSASCTLPKVERRSDTVGISSRQCSKVKDSSDARGEAARWADKGLFKCLHVEVCHCVSGAQPVVFFFPQRARCLLDLAPVAHFTQLLFGSQENENGHRIASFFTAAIYCIYHYDWWLN